MQGGFDEEPRAGAAYLSLVEEDAHHGAGDGVFDEITGSATFGTNVIPVFCQARDLLTIWFSDNSTPLKFNQSGNVATLGGSPPAGRGAEFHVNRIWTWGDNSNPSVLTYGSSSSAEDFTGADTGTISVDPEDGDRIIRAVSHKGRLVVFKGPNYGSIHMIAGTAPTGTDAFSRTLLIRGLALQSPNGIVAVGDDLWFLCHDGVYSLAATVKFGNFATAALTFQRPGARFFLNSVNRSRLNRSWAVHYAQKNCVLFTMASSGNGFENRVLCLSYIDMARGLQPSLWTRTCLSAAIRIHPTTTAREPVFGNTAGRVLRQDVAARNIETSTSYSFRVRTPQLIMVEHDASGRPRGDQPVMLRRAFLRTQSTGNYDITMRLARDEKAAESYTFNQSQTGFLLGTDVLGTGVLGSSSNMQLVSTDIAGECRAVSVELVQGGLDQDANIHEVVLTVAPTAPAGAATL